MRNFKLFRSPIPERITPRDFLFGVLALMPVAALLFLVRKYAVDLPFWDDWDYVPGIRKIFEGELPFQWAWRQQNEHRCFFPALIQISLAWLTGWNLIAQIFFNFTLALGIFFVFSRQILLTGQNSGVPKMRWLIPVAALLVFSLDQWENWLWGVQLVVFFQVICTVLCLFCLSNFPCRRSDYLRALAMGGIASFSFGSGLLVWPIGVLILGLDPFREAKKRKMLLWGLAGMAVFQLYFSDYRQLSRHPQLEYALQDFEGSFRYFFVYLGSAIANFNVQAAFWTGISGAAASSLLLIALLKIKRLEARILAPYLAFSLYAVGCGIQVVLMRSAFGEAQALCPRYVIHSNFFWISFCVLLALFLAKPRESLRVRRGILLFSGLCIFGALILFSLKSSEVSAIEFKKRHDLLIAARAELSRYENGGKIPFLYPYEAFLRRNAEFLKKYKLSVFRGEPV